MDLLARVRQALPARVKVYAVGGALRDLLLQRENHDADFALQGDVLGLSRRAADRLGAAYYPLDEERQTARVVWTLPGGRRQVLDFAAWRGPDLESDLRARDFTLNAIALDLDEPDRLIDPLDGAADLRAGRIRACSPTSLQDDPLRILRGVRQAVDLGFRIQPETLRLMRQAAAGLARVSPERIRDELFRLLEGNQPATGMRLLDALGALPVLLPELTALHGVEQSPPHTAGAWDHTLYVMENLGRVLNVLSLQPDPDKSANWAFGYLSGRLGRFRQALHDHLAAGLNPVRPQAALLQFAALYHDSGKPATRTLEPDGRVRFFEHEDLGARIAAERAGQLHLSNAEVERVEAIVRGHMRPLLLAQAGEPPTRRAIYRFFRATGPAGVDICLLSLGDVLGTYGPTLPKETWIRHLDVVRLLLEAWWERPAEQVAPLPLVNGHELMQAFGLSPGPRIGALLEAIREAQAEGQVQTREQALALAERILTARAGE